VELKSGGTIVIDRSEALVAVDVNSGKGTRHGSIEQTAYVTNLEAAEEIVRQLKLRDLGGLIVIDFIDMKDAKHKSAVEKAMKAHLKADKARTKVGRISQFGLMELSRQRLRPPIEFGTYESCKFCGGKGVTPSAETIGLGFLRRLSLELLKDGVESAKGIVPTDVANYLLNRKRKEIMDLEAKRNIEITIVGDGKLKPNESKIVYDHKKGGC
jgi:ribonuclease E